MSGIAVYASGATRRHKSTPPAPVDDLFEDGPVVHDAGDEGGKRFGRSCRIEGVKGFKRVLGCSFDGKTDFADSATFEAEFGPVDDQHAMVKLAVDEVPVELDGHIGESLPAHDFHADSPAAPSSDRMAGGEGESILSPDGAA